MPLSPEQARLNRQKGGGRAKGQLAKSTLIKLKATQRFNDRVFKITDKLFDAQAVVALGTYKMIRMYKDESGMPHVETIRDETRMQNLLDTGQYGVDYIVVAGEAPDWKAANALLDRAYGKAKESIHVEGEVKFSLKNLAEERKAFEAVVLKETLLLPEEQV